jgi:methionyl-tRNA formyltransferase
LLAVSEVAPGEVVDLRDQGIGVGTGGGVLGLKTVQLAGKKAMPAADLVRGQRQIVGAVLGG